MQMDSLYIYTQAGEDPSDCHAAQFLFSIGDDSWGNISLSLLHSDKDLWLPHHGCRGSITNWKIHSSFTYSWPARYASLVYTIETEFQL